MMQPRSFYSRRGKRLLDLSLALPLTILGLPLAILVTLLIAVTMGGPILFRQRRPGFGRKPFVIFKFRTMVSDASTTSSRPDDQRLTRVGRWLRRTSLDEIPELWNVLRGDMSLVGPRPLLMEYLDLYTPEQMRRHEVLPGLTGWAQVNGRNALTWKDRFALDLWYVDNLSLKVDLRVLLLTLGQVISGEGISAEGHATMPKFRGSNDE
jgi:lipopolysaccharide/colanic/teichoic acid biosynthesis glycosyltransferase